jgi:hypothetical protein
MRLVFEVSRISADLGSTSAQQEHLLVRPAGADAAFNARWHRLVATQGIGTCSVEQPRCWQYMPVKLAALGAPTVARCIAPERYAASNASRGQGGRCRDPRVSRTLQLARTIDG